MSWLWGTSSTPGLSGTITVRDQAVLSLVATLVTARFVIGGVVPGAARSLSRRP